MKYLYKSFLLFFLNFVLFYGNSYGGENQLSDLSIKINLKDELKKGNFLIGIKQYLGANNKNNSKSKTLLFESEDYLNLSSTNGLSHTSKRIEIAWKKVPLKKPKIIERLVLGPFASYESAKRKSDLLNLDGIKPLIVYPEQWELWLPISVSEAKKYNFKSVHNLRLKTSHVDEYSMSELITKISILLNG